MEKIVILSGLDRLKTYFTDDVFEKVKKYGDLTVNTQQTDPSF